MSEKKETPILKAEHLTKMFPVKKRKLIEKQRYVHAAEDVSFEVYPGEVLGIVGESGSGKSTLARTILALTPSTSGQVFYQGEDITDFKVSAGEKRRLRSEIQMIFQDPYASLNPKIKIGNAIAEPMLLHGQASSYLIKNGLVVDGSGKPAVKADVAVKGDKVARIAPDIQEPAAEVYDAAGKYVIPGLIDPHVHEEWYCFDDGRYDPRY